MVKKVSKVSWRNVSIHASRAVATQGAKARALLAWSEAENPEGAIDADTGDVVFPSGVDFTGARAAMASRRGSDKRGESQAKTLSVYLEPEDRAWLDAQASKQGSRSGVIAALIAAARAAG